MEFWLVTTDHFSDKILFRDEEDFKVAMNYVAVVKYVTGVNILAFILMSNHVHFVLECMEKEAVDYINRFKGLYGKHFQRKYGVKEYMRRNDIDIRPLKMEDESLHRAIAYVLMNSVSARLCVYSNEYRWGSGRAYYSSMVEEGVRLGSKSKRAQQRALHSWVPLNPEWILLKDGYISPSSYVSVSFVEALYRTPNLCGSCVAGSVPISTSCAV